MSVTLLLLLLIASYFVFKYLRQCYVLRDGMPGPWPIPLFGWNFLEVVSNSSAFHLWLQTKSLQYGSLYRGWYWSTPDIIVSAPSAIHQMLVTKQATYDRSPTERKAFADLLGGGLLLEPNGEKWKSYRGIVSPAFTPKAIRTLGPMLQRHSETMITILKKREGTTVDMQEVLQKFTFDVIGDVTLGIELDTQKQENSQFAKAWHDVLNHYMWRFIVWVPYWKVFRTQGVRRFDEAMKLLNATIMKAVDEPAKNTSSLLHLLQHAQKETPSITKKDISAQIFTFLFAGHDTTTNILMWALHYTSVHHEFRGKLQREVDDKALEVGIDGLYQCADTLPLLSCLVKETLRLMASAPLRGRLAQGNDNLMGYKIRKGDVLTLMFNGAHRNSEIWSAPDEFHPERFLDATLKVPAGGFVPFGAGPRRCVGETLAMAEISVALAVLLYAFDFSPATPPPEEILSLTISSKNGLRMNYKSRH